MSCNVFVFPNKNYVPLQNICFCKGKHNVIELLVGSAKQEKH